MQPSLPLTVKLARLWQHWIVQIKVVAWLPILLIWSEWSFFVMLDARPKQLPQWLSAMLALEQMRRTGRRQSRQLQKVSMI